MGLMGKREVEEIISIPHLPLSLLSQAWKSYLALYWSLYFMYVTVIMGLSAQNLEHFSLDCMY